jgi:hypothetical protein
MRSTTLTLLACLAAATPAAAQEAAPVPRYTFTPVPDGALRLDTQTGDVSFCAGTAASGACTPVVDEARQKPPAGATAADDRIAALERRIAALEARVEQAPSALEDENMDRVLTLTDRMLRQFFGLVREMKRDLQGETL